MGRGLSHSRGSWSLSITCGSSNGGGRCNDSIAIHHGGVGICDFHTRIHKTHCSSSSGVYHGLRHRRVNVSLSTCWLSIVCTSDWITIVTDLAPLGSDLRIIHLLSSNHSLLITLELQLDLLLQCTTKRFKLRLHLLRRNLS